MPKDRLDCAFPNVAYSVALCTQLARGSGSCPAPNALGNVSLDLVLRFGWLSEELVSQLFEVFNINGQVYMYLYIYVYIYIYICIYNLT